MKVFLVEDSISLRTLIARRLRAITGVQLVGEASGAAQALALIGWTRPDVVLVDLALTEGSGLRLLASLRDTGFVGWTAVLTGLDNEAYRRPSMEAGADAVYDKASGLETLFSDLEAKEDGFASMAKNPAADPMALLREGLTCLEGGRALCARLGRSSLADADNDVNVAVYVMHLKDESGTVGQHVDELLQFAEEQLCNTLKETDVIALDTSNQLSIVVASVDDASRAAERGQQFARRMSQPFRRGNRDWRFSVDLGIALFPVGHLVERGLVTLAEATAFGAC
ncbi:response regulator [Paucibacter sp. R3-3]|uniref:Response regulator n=1 Tax=Roseateles agri TaxID=3098619 RepID=A0ABU5DKR9_9BURK|nr:response regulator [Paucibacter sp. R3-3]MDY0746899.1 response regulator [Paucibacter sp. R3-3]